MDKPTKMFDQYAKNLEAVKSHPRIHIEPDNPDVILCPQCFQAITRDELQLEVSPFSLEHVPPKSLGGSVRTFTCRDCNSWSGHYLDSDLLHYLQLHDFVNGIPSSTVDAKVTISDEARINAELMFTENGILQILGNPERSNPDHIERVNQLMAVGSPTINLRFSGRRGRGVRQRHPEAALLRIAYLYAFSVFGYGFLINFGSQAVRSQFKQPEKVILPSWGISLNQSLPDNAVGINIINSPSELRSFMVVFDLHSGTRRMRYSVLLPGPTAPGAKIYEYLSAQERKGSSIPIKFTPIPTNYDYLNKLDAAFTFHEIWKIVGF